jgi:hypothetical protein
LKTVLKCSFTVGKRAADYIKIKVKLLFIMKIYTGERGEAPAF